MKGDHDREFSPFWTQDYWDNYRAAGYGKHGECCCVCGKGVRNFPFLAAIIRNGGGFGHKDTSQSSVGFRGHMPVCKDCAKNYAKVWKTLGYMEGNTE